MSTIVNLVLGADLGDSNVAATRPNLRPSSETSCRASSVGYCGFKLHPPESEWLMGSSLSGRLSQRTREPNKATGQKPCARKTVSFSRSLAYDLTCIHGLQLSTKPSEAAGIAGLELGGVKMGLRIGYGQECAHDRNKTAPLFNHLVRDGEYFVRNL